MHDRINKFVRGLSVAASSSMLVFAAVGSASAHPLSLTTSVGVDAGREALAALILRYEPFEDAAGIDALVDEVLASWPDAATVALGLLDDDAHEAEVEVEAEDEADEAHEADEADEADDDDEADEAHEAEVEVEVEADDDDEADEADDDDEADED